MQYMKSTFAEEVERERARMAEYADDQGARGHAHRGRGGRARSWPGPPDPSSPRCPRLASTPAVVKSAPLPKLTAAAPVPQPRDDEGTLLVDGSEVLASVEAARPAVQPIVGSEPQTDPERAEGAPFGEAEPGDDAPVSPVDETIVRLRPGIPTPVPAGQAVPPGPPPLPPRPAPTAPVAEVPLPPASSPTPAPLEEVAGLPVLGTVGTPAPEQAPVAEKASQPAAPAPEVARAPPAPGFPTRDFPSVSPVLAGQGASPTAELEALDRAPALGAARSGFRVWPWALLGIVAVGAMSAAWVLGRRAPDTGRVVLDVSPPEARGRVRLTVAGADLGVPTHWPVVQPAPSGKVEILASADGFKPALVEATVGRGNAATSVLVPLQRAATVARFTVLPEPDDAEVRLDGQVVKRSGSHGRSWASSSPARSTTSRCGAPATARWRRR